MDKVANFELTELKMIRSGNYVPQIVPKSAVLRMLNQYCEVMFACA